MEHERLLLAGILLVITRTVTFIAAPTPVTLKIDATPALIALDQGRSSHHAEAEKNPTDGDEHPFQSVSGAGNDSENPVQDQVSYQLGVNDCRKVGSAVVTVHAGREIGSGSVVSVDGLVITNHHVVRRLRNRPLFVEMLSGSQFEGQVIASDRQNDLALLRLNTQDALPVVPLASTNFPTIGQPVCAIGSPFGQAGKTTEGKLTNILSNGDLESDVVLQPGNSGGPLLNSQGEMIGVNKGVARSTGNQGDLKSFATNVSIAKAFIEQNRSNQSSAPDFPAPRSHSDTAPSPP
ncbi:MAG: trypsin-like serine protease [Leptolyngbyaceae cyanobacterium RU_5_1]|nr:trypsin-like serine protease [Leptolyngbyaceae cyanobacterium RU_5_1]